MSSRRSPWATPAAVALLIMVGATLPGSAVSALPGGRGSARTLLEQVVHLGEFVVFAVATRRAAGSACSSGRAASVTLLAVVVLALGSESAQLMVPGRMFDVMDLTLDGLGGLGGLALASGAGARGS
jgi:hypothetical protein